MTTRLYIGHKSNRQFDEETEELSADLENIAGDLADLTKINGKGGIQEKRWAGRSTSWNQDCREKYQ